MAQLTRIGVGGPARTLGTITAKSEAVATAPSAEGLQWRLDGMRIHWRGLAARLHWVIGRDW